MVDEHETHGEVEDDDDAGGIEEEDEAITAEDDIDESDTSGAPSARHDPIPDNAK